MTPRRTSQLLTAAGAGLVPGVLTFHSGGYFPSEWGLELGFFGLVMLLTLILADRVTLTPPELVVLASLFALAVWSLVSIAWSSGPDAPVQAAERTLIYVAAVGALLLTVSRDRISWLLGGLLAGIAVVCLYALSTRLFAGSVGNAADVVTGTRLASPIGYANALGALAAFGVVLALGFAYHDLLWVRVAAGAVLVPLAAALYFTLSRGSVIALAAGLVVFLAADRSGSGLGALAGLAIAPAAGVLLCVRSPLLDGGLSGHEARSSGHRLALELAALLVAGGAAGGVGRAVARRIVPLVWVALAAGAAIAAAAIVLAGPLGLVHRVSDAYNSEPPRTETHPSHRLLSSSSSGRSEYWKVAARMVQREPLLGEGAGSYERWWLQERPVGNDARNAHNLYLETLAELGPVGLALLLTALLTPVLRRDRRPDPLGAGALGAYLTWLVHALLDWDWQIPAVTLVGLACAAVLLVQAREAEIGFFLTRVRRGFAIAAVVPFVGVALIAHVGNRAADSSQTALGAGRPSDASGDARLARTWMPWAAEPWRLLGEAQLAAREDAVARTSLRRALSRDGDDWLAWYDLAAVTSGAAHRRALGHARRLNPLAAELAGGG